MRTLALAAVLLFLSSLPAHALECHSSHSREHRTYRIVDGRKCWTAHFVSKSQLTWRKDNDVPADNSPDREYPVGNGNAVSDGDSTVVVDAEDQVLATSYWPDLPPEESIEMPWAMQNRFEAGKPFRLLTRTVPIQPTE